MKNVAEYSRRVKKLLTTLRKETGHVSLTPIEEPMDAYMQGILGNYAAESRAASAASKLKGAIVDYNELRVTPVSEIAELIGDDYPMVRQAAEEVSRGLNAVYNKLHHLDLSFLKKAAKKTAEAFLTSLDGISPHARGVVLLRCLKSPCVPLDVHMLAYLHKLNCVPEDATPDTAQKFISHEVSEREALSIYASLKRYASAHAPRKGEKVPLPAMPDVEEDVMLQDHTVGAAEMQSINAAKLAATPSLSGGKGRSASPPPAKPTASKSKSTPRRK